MKSERSAPESIPLKKDKLRMEKKIDGREPGLFRSCQRLKERLMPPADFDYRVPLLLLAFGFAYRPSSSVRHFSPARSKSWQTQPEPWKVRCASFESPLSRR